MAEESKINMFEGIIGIGLLLFILWIALTFFEITLKSIKSILQGNIFSNNNAYTLYRTSVLDEIARIHIASFDSTEGERYNFDACVYTKELYEKQEGVKTRFWCEKGRYKK